MADSLTILICTHTRADLLETITAEEGPIPGGGSLVVRRPVFELAGQFSTELGPHGTIWGAERIANTYCVR